jgi:hypothetical protein
MGGAVSGLRLRCVLFADSSDKAYVPHATEHLSCNIRTAGVVAEVFRQQFFTPIRSREARFDRYLRNGDSPPSTCILGCVEGLLCEWILWLDQFSVNDSGR